MKHPNTAAIALALLGGVQVAVAQDAPAPQEETAPAAAAQDVPAAEPSAAQETVATIPLEPAEPTPVAAAEAGSGSRLIEEIIVTAQRREENVKDVPISISAFSPSFLEAAGVSAQQDLPKITPGLVVGNPVGFATTYIRGIGSDAFILADPLVVTYIDGVYFPASTTQFQDFGDVEQIEIAKGPQGTLFGRNALGGVIAIKSRDPSLTEVQGSTKYQQLVYTGSDSGRGAWSTSGFVSIPVTETFAFSVSGLVGKNDPYFDQYVGPENNRRLVEDGDSYAYRIKTLWQPMDDLSVKLSYYHSYTNDPQRQFGANTDPSGALGAPLPAQEDPWGRTDFNDIPYSWDRTKSVSGAIDWNLPWFRTQLIGARQHILAIRNADFDGTDMPVAYFDDIDGEDCRPYCKPFFSEGDNLELRFLSNDFAPDWLELVGGLYYYEQESGVGGARFFGAGTDLSQGVIAGFEVPGLQGIYDDVLEGLLADIGVSPTGAVLALKGGLREKSEAVYAQGTIKFTDWVSLTLGVRAQRVERSVREAAQQVYVDGDTQIPFAEYDGKDDPQYFNKDESVDPKAVLSFRPTVDWLGNDPLIYVSYQVASTGGTFNSLSLLEPPDIAKGSELTSYEAGIKTFLFDGITSVDAAVFHYKEKDPQTQVVSLQTGGAVNFENAKELQITGGELAVVTPLFPSLTGGGLVWTLGVSYLDSEYSSYPNASGFDPDTGLYSGTNDFSGNRVVQTPEYTIATGLSQTLHWGNSTFELGADWYYNDGFYFAAQNTPNTEIGSYELVGITTSWLYEPWRMRLSAFGRNIMDEEYLAARFINDFGVNDYPAPKSVWGASLKWDF